MITVTKQWDHCKFSFTKPFFKDSSVYRLCTHRKKLWKAVTEWQSKYRDLEKKFDTLYNFVTANVRVIPPLLVERLRFIIVPPRNCLPASQR